MPLDTLLFAITFGFIIFVSAVTGQSCGETTCTFDDDCAGLTPCNYCNNNFEPGTTAYCVLPQCGAMCGSGYNIDCSTCTDGCTKCTQDTDGYYHCRNMDICGVVCFQDDDCEGNVRSGCTKCGSSQMGDTYKLCVPPADAPCGGKCNHDADCYNSQGYMQRT